MLALEFLPQSVAQPTRTSTTRTPSFQLARLLLNSPTRATLRTANLNAVPAMLRIVTKLDNNTKSETSPSPETSKSRRRYASRDKANHRKPQEADPRRLPHALLTTLADLEISQTSALTSASCQADQHEQTKESVVNYLNERYVYSCSDDVNYNVNIHIYTFFNT